MIVKMIEESFNEPFKTGPLIDQQGRYAIFDILMNRQMFDYIMAQSSEYQGRTSRQFRSRGRLSGRPKSESGQDACALHWRLHAQGLMENPVVRLRSRRGISTWWTPWC